MKKEKSEQAKACSDVVAELGFEPRHTESESAVLPLHNSASHYIIITIFKNMSRDI